MARRFRLGMKGLRRLIPCRFAAAPRGTGERIPPLRFAHPLLSAFDLRIYGWRVSVYK